MTGEMNVIDGTGDTRILWDSTKPEEVEVARDTFNKLRSKGYMAYKVKAKGDKGEIVTVFDPDAERLILAPAVCGG